MKQDKDAVLQSLRFFEILITAQSQTVNKAVTQQVNDTQAGIAHKCQQNQFEKNPSAIRWFF